MEVKRYYGSLLDSKAQILVHQVNCQGKMGSGIAKTIRETYPIVYESYNRFCQQYLIPEERLGKIDVVKVSNKQAFCNLFGQLYYGYDGKRYTSYDAVSDALEKLRDFCVEKGVKSIAFPVNMGCGLGGAKWAVIAILIMEIFEKTDILIELWEFNNGKKK